jgi:endoglycosylceramidase
MATVVQVTGASGSSAGASPTPSATMLGHVGRWIVDAQGRVEILHGLNMVNKRAPYTPVAAGFGAAAALTLAENGFDVVRLGVIYGAVEPRPGVFNHRYIRSIARTVALLASDGVYTLLDFHQDEMSEEFGGEGFPSWSVETGGLPVKRFVFPLAYTESPALDLAYENFWADAPGPGGVGLQQRYVAAWEQVAREFAGDPWVLGYDVFNEPWPADATNAELASFYSRVIAGIRSVDRRHLIWYEPYVTFNFGVQTELPAFADSDLGMSFHDYCLANAEQEPTACATSEEATVANALAHSQATGVALMVTEFGATDDYEDLGRVVATADANQLSWIEWSYCGCEDPTGSIPPRTEALVYDPSRPGTGANINLAKLKVLAEPYPRVVSGTPLSYSFDRATGTFHLVFSTTAPDGHRFGPGACTAVIVPPVQYPTGYRVTVAGGRVLSTAGSGVLEIESASTAQEVAVTVTPARRGHTTAPGQIPATCR